MSNRYHNLEAFRRTVADLMADPDITGDLLLAGVWLARATILGEPERGKGNWSTTAMACDLHGDSQDRHLRSLRRTFESDLPRYDAKVDNPEMAFTCGAPMVRRSGPCGQPWRHWQFITDLNDGGRIRLAACNRHRSWLDEQCLRNRDEVKAIGDHLPKPAVNAGGALARHIHGIWWTKWWQMLDPKWTPPAEGEPSHKPTRRPTLTVLTFEPNDEQQQPAAGDRPTFTVVEGGRR